MSASTESLRAQHRRISPWIVMGTIAALLVALTVLTFSRSEAPTAPRAPVVAATSTVTNDVAEMAALKSAFSAQRFGAETTASSVNPERAVRVALKAHVARELQQAQGESETGG